MNLTNEIKEGVEFKQYNLVSCRKKMFAQEIVDEIAKLGDFLSERGVSREGPLISATHGLEMVDGQQKIDFEFMVPVNRQINLPNQYSFKSTFHLVNAIHRRYIGEPAGLKMVYEDILNYLQTKKLVQITPFYNVEYNKVTLEHKSIDVYIGINPSIL